MCVKVCDGKAGGEHCFAALILPVVAAEFYDAGGTEEMHTPGKGGMLRGACGASICNSPQGRHAIQKTRQHETRGETKGSVNEEASRKAPSQGAGWEVGRGIGGPVHTQADGAALFVAVQNVIQHLEPRLLQLGHNVA